MQGDSRILFRVDPRLIHATLMNAWVPELGAKLIIVADGEVVSHPRLRTILEMSAMDTEVSFTSEADVRLALARRDLPATIVLFSSIEAVLRAMESGLRLSSLNVGHIPEGPDRKPLHPAVHLGPKDFDLIRRIESRGIEVYIQPLPTDDPIVPETASNPALPVERTVKDRVEVINERGLHLRAAHLLAQLASKMEADVQIGKGTHLVNAKSLLGLTTLGATCGTMLDVVVSGPGARAGMEAIRDLFARGFYEGEGSGRS
jgi:phosphotransferase system HPr (HPr) family protein